MVYLFDSYYSNGKTRTACLGLKDWESPKASLRLSQLSETTSDYQSGEFYKRELPGILELLEQIDLQNEDAILVDAYVYLDDAYAKGLGAHLYEALEQKIPVLGLAKRKYQGLEQLCQKVYRGQSQKALYLSCAGMELDVAQKNIESMAGSNRIPDMMQAVDALSKGRG